MPKSIYQQQRHNRNQSQAVKGFIALPDFIQTDKGWKGKDQNCENRQTKAKQAGTSDCGFNVVGDIFCFISFFHIIIPKMDLRFTLSQAQLVV